MAYRNTSLLPAIGCFRMVLHVYAACAEGAISIGVCHDKVMCGVWPVEYQRQNKRIAGDPIPVRYQVGAPGIGCFGNLRAFEILYDGQRHQLASRDRTVPEGAKGQGRRATGNCRTSIAS
ncbi:hypothetical protein BGZ60DRAFT_125530 [Tricladium varicosporioides]|nr:hypothetical protein BGZ60DRAFT_125530 [Hymenoscyphus varicosporioides]